MIHKNQNFRRGLLTFLIACVSLFYSILHADDTEAVAAMEKAKSEFTDGDFSDAAETYMGAKLLADTAGIKFNALVKAAAAYGKADLKFKQFQCLEELVEGFPDRIDFEKVVTQEYEIGNDFAKGHRDVSLSWIPWIKGENKAPEIYESVIKQAPFAKFAPVLKLKMGRMYLEDGKNRKAMQTFRTLIKQHPESKEAKYARFELANGLVQLANKAGDGDGSYAREAEDVLKETLTMYPKDPETTWIKESIRETDDVRAQRLYNLAKFYKSRKNPEAAKRYFNDLIARFPESEFVEDAEHQLVELDENYKPKGKVETDYEYPYPRLKMRDERNVILVAPEASGGKWLLPIEDLDPDSVNADAEYKAKKEAEEEARRKAEEKRKAEIAARKAEKERLEAERKAKEKAEAEEKAKKEKEEEERRRKEAEEKAKKLHKEAERLEAERLEAETKKKEEAAAKKKAEEEEKKKEAEEERKKKEAEEAAKKKGEPATVKDTPDNDEKKESSNIIPIVVLIVIIILAIVGGIIYFAKKKKQV